MHERFDKPRRPRLRALAAMTVTVVVGAGLVPAVLAPAAQAAGTVSATQEPETVVPAEVRWYPQQEAVLTAGAGGYLAESDAQTFRWVNAADGSAGPAVGAQFTSFNDGVHGGLQQGSTATVELTDYASGSVSTVTAPAGQTWTGGFTDDTIVTSQPGPGGLGLHLIRAAEGGGAPADTTVAGVPAGAAYPKVLSQSGRLAVVQLQVDGTDRTYLLDSGAASLREIFTGQAGILHAVIGGTRVVGWTGGATVYSVRLDDPAGTVEQTPVPAADRHDVKPATPVPVGDRILFVRAASGTVSAGQPLLSVPVGGGDAQTLLAHALWSYAVAPDGSVLVTGGSGPTDWAVRRITAASGADPVLSTVTALPAIPATVFGLSYSGGRLAYATDSRSDTPLMRRDVTSGAEPAVSGPSLVSNVPAYLDQCQTTTGTSTLCARLQGLGTGTVAYLNGSVLQSPDPSTADGFWSSSYANVSPGPGTLTDGSLRYAIVNNPARKDQNVITMGTPDETRDFVDRPITASAVWGSTLWVPGTAAGTVRPYDLRTNTFGTTVTTAATCGVSFNELQANGRWLYWSCGTTAGIHDRQTGKDIPVPAGTVGDALLGDGYLVRHDAASGTLQLTDVHTGAAVTSTLASLPETITGDRDVLWAVDKYGGGVAYVDAQQRIHVLPLADLPRSPVALLASTADPSVWLAPSYAPNGLDWHGSWTFSRPVAAWTLTVRNAAGAVVHTDSGTAPAPGSTVTDVWHIDGDAARSLRNGTYRWTLTAQPGNGDAGAVTATGTVELTGDAVQRDFEADARGDLFGLTSAGKLDVRDGTAAGGLSMAGSGSGWPSSDTLVPFGDLDGDRYNDLLVRDSSGRLWLYSGHGNPTFVPSAPHTLLGSGFQQYNLLVNGGDMNGDGISDLLARDSSGRLWLHAGTAAGGFAARTLVGTGYQQYTLIAGGAWMDGDRMLSLGQIIARDASGVLWRHSSDGKGRFQARERIGSGWNQYDSLVEAGSLTGTGWGDLLARDARGGLWRFADNEKSGVTGPLWEGGGWQTYARLL